MKAPKITYTMGEDTSELRFIMKGVGYNYYFTQSIGKRIPLSLWISQANKTQNFYVELSPCEENEDSLFTKVTEDSLPLVNEKLYEEHLKSIIGFNKLLGWLKYIGVQYDLELMDQEAVYLVTFNIKNLVPYIKVIKSKSPYSKRLTLKPIK